MSAAAQDTGNDIIDYRLHDSGEVELVDPMNSDAYCRLEHAQDAVNALVAGGVPLGLGVYFVTAIGHKWVMVFEGEKLKGYRVHVTLRITE